MPPDVMYAPNSEYHRQRRWVHTETVHCLQAAIAQFGCPNSLLDVGCGQGALVEWAQSQHIGAMGIDLAAPADHPDFVRADLCEPIDLGQCFEWVLCWEVAEHLPESAAETLCQTIARHVAPNGRVLFTAARPGQRGPGHVNCQPPVYWVDKFAALGLLPAAASTMALAKVWQRVAPRASWYARNLLIFDRGAL